MSVCDLIPKFMSFVSLDCTYTGSKIDHSDTVPFYLFFLLPVCIYISLSIYIYTIYFDKSDVNEVLRLLTVYMQKCDFSNLVFASSDIVVCSLLPRQ